MKSLALLALIISSSAYSQTVIDVTNADTRLNEKVFTVLDNGTPFVNAKFVRLVKGSQYFQDDWMEGVLIAADSRQQGAKQVKLDLIDNQIHFLNTRGDELIATTPATEIILSSSTGDKYRFIHSDKIPEVGRSDGKGFYQLLASGNTSAYKYFEKILTDVKPYGSATSEQTITTREKYFVTKNGALVGVKKLKDIPDILSDRKAELTEFLKLRDRKDDSLDDRLGAIIEYYNSLPAPVKQN